MRNCQESTQLSSLCAISYKPRTIHRQTLLLGGPVALDPATEESYETIQTNGIVTGTGGILSLRKIDIGSAGRRSRLLRSEAYAKLTGAGQESEALPRNCAHDHGQQAVEPGEASPRAHRCIARAVSLRN